MQPGWRRVHSRAHTPLHRDPGATRPAPQNHGEMPRGPEVALRAGMNTKRWMPPLAVALLAACGGSAAATGDGGPGGDDGGLPPDDDASLASAFTAAQVQAAQARCGLPHGPALALATQGQAKGLLEGSWLLCVDASTTMFSPGITLMPDGSWYRLNADGSGGLLRGLGVQDQGTWSVQCTDESPLPDSQPCPGSSITLRMDDVGGDLTASGCAGGTLSFESAPQRMYLPDDLGEWCTGQPVPVVELWLVPL